MAYITVDDLAEYLGMDSTSDDILLVRLIDAATAVIDRETGRQFAAGVDSVRYFSVNSVDWNRLTLDGDLCAITSIVNGDGTVVSGSQYVTQPRNGTPWYAIDLKPTSGIAWDGVSGEIAITGRWGYSVEPDDAIRQACIELAAYTYRKRDNITGDERGVSAVGGGSVMTSRTYVEIMQLLTRYKVRT